MTTAKVAPRTYSVVSIHSAAPRQRVAMFGAEETEMADLGSTGILRRHRDDLGLDRGKTRAQQFHRRPRRPGIVGHTQRAQCAFVFRKVCKRGEVLVVEH